MATNFAGLPTAGTVTDTDLLWLEQSGLPRKLAISSLRSAIAGSGAFARLDTSIQAITAPADWRLAANTVAGADTLQLRLQSGGAFSTSRGAILELNGANAAADPGAWRLLATAGSTSVINPGAGSLVQFQNGTFEFTGTPQFTAIANFYGGTVSAQRVHTRFGWSNGVQRWTTAMESDASFSWYNYNTSGTGASRLVNMVGSHSGQPRFIVDGEIVARDGTATPGQFRQVAGNYGSFWRQDSTNLYLLLTASGDQYGTWNTLRPLSVGLASGLVSMGNGLSFGTATGASNTDLSKHIALYGTQYGFSVTGSRLNYVAPNFARHYFVVNGLDAVSITVPNQGDTISVAGGVTIAGSSAALFLPDRSTSRGWAEYTNADYWRWWNGSTDVMTLDPSGNVGMSGYLNVLSGDQYLQNKHAFRGNDSWLRLNPTGDFTSGIYGGSGVLRHDGNLDLSNSGYLTLQGGLRLSKITVSTSAPGTMQNGELWIQY